MGLYEDIMQKADGSVLLLDTSAITPNCGMGLTEILFEGVPGLYELEPEYLSYKIERIQEIEHLMREERIAIIPEVYKEMQKYVHILQQQHTSVSGELRKNARWFEHADFSYFRDILESIYQHIIATRSCIKKLQSNCVQQTQGIREGNYFEFLHTARERSHDLRRQTREKKELHQRPVHLGEELETDQHMVTTAFIIAYSRPVTLVTGDYGIIELTRRVYESVVQGRIPEAREAERYEIPEHAINVINTYPYAREAMQAHRSFLR